MMNLRTRLLLVNSLAMAFLIGALVISYWHMLLNKQQTWLLTMITLGAAILSSVAFSWLTLPITRSIRTLAQYSAQVADRIFDAPLGQVGGAAVICDLASSLYQMSERLQESFTALEAVERTRRELVANISHDLRTPMASIQSYVEALQDGVVERPEETKRYLQTIHNETRRLSALVDDLFDLSKLEAGQNIMNVQPHRIDQVLADVFDTHRLLLSEKQIEIVANVQDDLPVLWISVEKIHRVCSNLLDNAITHTTPGSTIEIAVVHLHDSMVEVSIADHGEGVETMHRQRIFERLYRTDPSRARATGGAGLGLAIAKRLVELHGGDIGVRDRDDRSSGAVFWFTLPINTVS